MSRRHKSAALALVLAALVALSGCAGVGSDVPDPKGVAKETTETSVYYSSGRTLFEERVVIDATDPYRAALDVLLKADPKSDKNVAIVEPQAKVLSVSFKDGVVTVDWAPEVLSFNADPSEKVLALAAVLRTYGEFTEVQKVRFTVEGKTSGSAGGKDIEAFWGNVSLKGQPWPVIRRQASTEGTTTN